MNSTEEYSDGIDNSESPFLKYEKTQNRDIQNTIERLNRAEKFRGSAKDVFDLITPILKRETEGALKDVWSSRDSNHSSPDGLSIIIDMAPPVMKKIHPAGDTDTYFKMHKEYPFYYLYNIKMLIRFVPSNKDPMKEDESWYGKWFIDNVFPEFNKAILEKIRSALDSKFSNTFAFPTIETVDDSNKVNTIENSINCTENRINVCISPALSFNRSNDGSIGVDTRFDSNEDMKNVLIFSIAQALERIIRI